MITEYFYDRYAIVGYALIKAMALIRRRLLVWHQESAEQHNSRGVFAGIVRMRGYGSRNTSAFPFEPMRANVDGHLTSDCDLPA